MIISLVIFHSGDYMRQYQIALIGTGKMGVQILKCLYDQGHTNITATRTAAHKQELASLEREYAGIKTTVDNRYAIEDANVVILCVKPDKLDHVLNEIKDGCKDKHIVSIAAGVTLEYLEGLFDTSNHISRVMTGIYHPNEIAWYTPGKYATEEDEETIKYIFGKSTSKVPEEHLYFRTMLACYPGILGNLSDSIKGSGPSDMDPGLFHKTFGKLLIAYGQEYASGVEGIEIFDRVSAKNPKSFTWRLDQHLKKFKWYSTLSDRFKSNNT